ncbi:hypothetical protein ACU4GD_45135 [Cupriavidus basilensis]
MRKQLCDALVSRAVAKDSKMVFLTGDLGFMALEPLQAAMGERFINAGVAEQNMISVAAALAARGWTHGPTASRRSAMPARLSRSGMTSVSTSFLCA